ncbi:hypothetical protein [Mucilaginibacter sp. OK098]|uniref:hypothetical protein n=1 Tax=Mucilaginibacter sp. OK098 TaxID=1855297 RepID=UPI0009217CDC|nr:hypothetical protein [Mucilaginibacter sp. OK098]SHN37631.1 YD repeat-containing protein [Mucilaginibacter sp. OK098]
MKKKIIYFRQNLSHRVINTQSVIINRSLKYKLHLYSFCLFFLGVLTVKGQNAGVYTSPPTTSSLGKYVDNPVSLYTGTPQITIPLYEIHLANGFKLPINLSYQAGGVKIEEQASDVGLNWSLLAGGMITRVVKGSPDDSDPLAANLYPNTSGHIDGTVSIGRFYHNDSSLPSKWQKPVNLVELFNPTSTDPAYLKSYLLNWYYGSPGPDYMLYSGSPYYDLDPDVFYFNFAGISGKFVFNVESGQIEAKTIPFQDLKISFTFDSSKKLNSFTIIDDKGNTYFFNDVENIYQDVISTSNNNPTANLLSRPTSDGSFSQVYTSGTSDAVTNYNSSWYLSKIIASNGQEIDFTYENDQIRSYEALPDYETGAPNSPENTRNVVFQNQKNGFWGTTSAKRLTSISTPNELITFPAQLNRLDVDNQATFATNGSGIAKAITGINIYQKQTNQLIKSFSLNYSYFQSATLSSFNLNNTNHVNTETGYNSYFKRLRLDSLLEIGNNNSKRPPFVFSYDTTYALPFRFSYQQDLWGYFNGASGNQVLIPKIYIYPDLAGDDRFRIYPKSNYSGSPSTYLNTVVWGSQINAADRLPNPIYTGAGSLIKMTYPTGGYTIYTYEPSAFFYDGETYSGGGLRIKQLDNYDATASSNPATSRQYFYTDDTNQSSGRVISLPRMGLLDGSYTNIVNEVKRSSVSQAPLGSTSGSNIGYKQVTEIIKNISNGTLGKTIYKYDLSGTQGEINDSYSYGLYNATQIYRSPIDQVSNIANYSFTPNSYPFSENTDYDWNRGQLVSKEDYDVNGKLVNKLVNKYDFFYNQKGVSPTKVYGLTIGTFIAAPADAPNPDKVYDYYVFGKYSYLTDVAKILTSSNEVYYNNSDSVSTINSYAYNGTYHANVTSSKLINSKKDSIFNYYFYPEDFEARQFADQTVCIDMVNKHMTNFVLQQSLYKNTTFLHSQFNHFWEPFTNLIVPKSYESFYPNNQPSEITTNFTKYDTFGNLLEFSKYNGPATSYQWGYNNAYPVAVVKSAKANNVFYNGFEEGSGNSAAGDAKTGHYSYITNTTPYVKALTGLDSGNYTLTYWYRSGNVWNLQTNSVVVTANGNYTINIPVGNQIDDVRFYPSDAQMTTYTYDPLIGLTSSTDAKGEITYYEYDPFQRLMNIKDKDGNIIKHMDYHYQQ